MPRDPPQQTHESLMQTLQSEFDEIDFLNNTIFGDSIMESILSPIEFSGYATTLAGEESNVRLRKPELYGSESEPKSLYPSFWDLIRKLESAGTDNETVKGEAKEAISRVLHIKGGDPGVVDILTSMALHGQIQRVIIDSERNLIAGTGRVLAVALANGIKALDLTEFQECVRQSARFPSTDTNDLELWAAKLWQNAKDCPSQLTCWENEDGHANRLAITENRCLAINDLDYGYFLKDLQDGGKTAAQIALDEFGGIPYKKAKERVDQLIKLTECDAETKTKLRNSEISARHALAKVEGTASAGAGKTPIVYHLPVKKLLECWNAEGEPSADKFVALLEDYAKAVKDVEGRSGAELFEHLGGLGFMENLRLFFGEKVAAPA